MGATATALFAGARVPQTAGRAARAVSGATRAARAKVNSTPMHKGGQMFLRLQKQNLDQKFMQHLMNVKGRKSFQYLKMMIALKQMKGFVPMMVPMRACLNSGRSCQETLFGM